LSLKWSGKITLPNKSQTEEKHYQASNCAQCPFNEECCKGQANRIIKFRPEYEFYKAQARKNLTDEEGAVLRKQRGAEVETPFADIKHNQGHRRVVLRSKEKVTIEIGFIGLAHNLKKINFFIKKAG